MDRGGGALNLARFATLAGAALASVLLASCASEAPVLDGILAPTDTFGLGAGLTSDALIELRWISAGADPVEVLSMRPAKCQTAATDERVAASRRLGEIAFESPALLGGAAARMGLSCGSCHLNGRSKATFFIAGVSGAPGTADITSSLLSKTRGDGVFNPVPIPDLAARDGNQMRDRTTDLFRRKMRALIIEEFDAQPPDETMFEAVIAYLDSLDVSACADPDASEPVRAGDHFKLARTTAAEATRGSKTADPRGELSPQASVFLLRSARFSLQRLSQRYFGSQHQDARARLEDISRRLGLEADAIRAGRRAAGLVKDAEWDRLATLLDRQEAASLYDPAILRAALGGAGP